MSVKVYLGWFLAELGANWKGFAAKFETIFSGFQKKDGPLAWYSRKRPVRGLVSASGGLRAPASGLCGCGLFCLHVLLILQFLQDGLGVIL